VVSILAVVEYLEHHKVEKRQVVVPSPFEMLLQRRTGVVAYLLVLAVVLGVAVVSILAVVVVVVLGQEGIVASQALAVVAGRTFPEMSWELAFGCTLVQWD